jgi:hypothetical protein
LGLFCFWQESGFAKLIKEADAAALSSEKAIAELQAFYFFPFKKIKNIRTH